jgi:hypothetical protein
MALVALPPSLAGVVEKLASRAPAGLPASRSIGERWCGLDWLPGYALRAQLASNVGLLGYRESIIDLDAEIADSALNLGVTKQQLNSPQIASAALDQRGLGPPQ